MKILNGLFTVVTIAMVVFCIFTYFDIISNNLDREPQYTKSTQYIVDKIQMKRGEN